MKAGKSRHPLEVRPRMASSAAGASPYKTGKEEVALQEWINLRSDLWEANRRIEEGQQRLKELEEAHPFLQGIRGTLGKKDGGINFRTDQWGKPNMAPAFQSRSSAPGPPPPPPGENRGPREKPPSHSTRRDQKAHCWRKHGGRPKNSMSTPGSGTGTP